MNTSDINRLLDNSATIETKIDILPRDETELIVTISNNDSVQSWEYSDTRYVPDNGFIGMFVERTLEGTLHNITEDFNIENREIILHLGIRVYDSESQTYNTNFYSLGNFIVDKPDSDEVKDNTKFTAKDYTIKFNRTFNPDFTDSEYTKSFTTLLSEQGSVTALWLAKYTCKQSGVELGSESFANSTFNITSNQFQNGEQCRDIIKAIAKLACTWARIDWDNKLYLDFDVKFAVEQDYNNITKDDYYSLTIQKDSFGPINKIVFGSSIIDGDYSFVSDENSISQHGENVVTIYDNPILYTEELREEAVKVGTRLVGLTYTPVEMETIGHPWLKGNELITVPDSADNVIYTYPFDRVIKYDGHIKTEIKSYAPTKVQADFTYQGTGTSKNAQKQTKIILDRANQQITSLIEKTDETTSQITSINQNLDKIELDVDTLNTKFESIGVTSKTVEGNPIHIEDAGAYDLEKLYLEGNSYQETEPTPDTPQEVEVIESVDVEVTNGLDSTDSDYQETIVTIDLRDNSLAKIGDVKDELDVVTGKLTKKIGKVVLDGSESWSMNFGTGMFHLTTFIPTKINKILCTHFIHNIVQSGIYNTLVDGEFATNGGANEDRNIYFKYTKFSTINEWKTWLASNNVTVYYILAEPYEVQLDQTLIGLYVGVNNITISANIGPSYSSLTYLTDVPLNAQYATKTQLQLNKDNITSVVQDTITLNTDLTNLQSLVGTETTNLKNSLGDLTNNLDGIYATSNDVLTVTNSVANIQTSLNQQIEITKDIQVNGVSKVKTTTGFTFDENGMTVTKTNADTKTTIDEDGMVIYSTTGSDNTEMLVVDSKGVVAENVSVNTFLIVGKNSRFQDYETGTGCFYIGE